MKKKLLTNGSIFHRTDNRWGGTVWYMDEAGERKRKSFSGTTKAEVGKKITAYIEQFNNDVTNSDEATHTLQSSMQHWLEVFKFPSVERTTYDRAECTAKHQIYPVLGDKIIADITSADIKSLLNNLMNDGYAYTTVKKTYVQLGEYFNYLCEQEILKKNPMDTVSMTKKDNFLASQGK